MYWLREFRYIYLSEVGSPDILDTNPSSTALAPATFLVSLVAGPVVVVAGCETKPNKWPG